MKLVSYNIQYGTGRDGRIDLARIARVVDGADLIALQEVERFAARTGMVDQAAALADLLPRYHWVYGAGMDIDASEVDAEGRVTMRRRQFGNMLLSRTPILAARNHLLPKFGTLVQYSLQRCALEGVVMTPGGRPLRAYSIHLSHLADGDRAPQVDALLDIHARAPSEGAGWCGTRDDPGWTDGRKPAPMPREAVIMGDFNLSHASPLYERIVGPMSPQYGRMTGLEGLVDTWVTAGHREDEGTTCLSGSHGHGERIDFCFASASLAAGVRAAWIDGDADGSDHQPIFVDLDF
jgi:endonuclease/exonuclease/phosphatase family metal-dependent hydrolase